MGTPSEKIKKEVVVLIKKTGLELLKQFKSKGIKAKFKAKNEIVTQADLLAEKIILKKLKDLTPAWRILSEESGDNHINSDYTWIVDPLDGTTNFYMGSPLFAVQMALVYKNEPILSLIYAPAIDEFYYAEKGKGAFFNNKKIMVGKRGLKQALLTYCHGSEQTAKKKAIKIYKSFKLNNYHIRLIGSAAIEFAWIANGNTDAYFSPGASPWDIIPGALLVQEAGGKVTDFSGKPWGLKSKTILASNAKIDKQLLKYLKNINVA
ncbi:inositol monophosphatase family protein [Patescibacteria group bacterium]